MGTIVGGLAKAGFVGLLAAGGSVNNDMLSNQQLQVQEAQSRLQAAQSRAQATVTEAQSNLQKAQAKITDDQAEQADAEAEQNRLYTQVKLLNVAKQRENQTAQYRTAQGQSKAAMGAANVDASSGSALSVLTGNAAQYGATMAANAFQRKLVEYEGSIADSKYKLEASNVRAQASYQRINAEYGLAQADYQRATASYYDRIGDILNSQKTGTLDMIGNAGAAFTRSAVGSIAMSKFNFFGSSDKASSGLFEKVGRAAAGTTSSLSSLWRF